ncbi:MAG TPA: histidine kinase dimerization/phospho-acceptor domain-containing protein [Steroidobacteraceae bacterium]
MTGLFVLIIGVLLAQTVVIVLLWIQRRRLQRSLWQARQLGINLAEAARRAAVGEMAAIVSHYIAQPLTAMLLNAEAATAELQASDPNREHLRDIVHDLRTDAARVTALLDRLRGASKTEQHEFELLDVNALATSIVPLIETAARQLGITVRTDLAPGLPGIRGSPIQLQEVLLSLLMGALNQLRTMSGQRVLTIRTMQRAGDIGLVVHHTGVAADPVRQDPSDVPSFSDLSLAIVRAILDAHGGRLWTESLPDGAALGFFIPAHARTR